MLAFKVFERYKQHSVTFAFIFSKMFVMDFVRPSQAFCIPVISISKAERAFCSFRSTTSPTRRFVQVGGRLPLGPRRAARRSARRPDGGRTRQTARCARFRPPRNSGLFGYLQNSGALGVFRLISISPISPAAPSRAAPGSNRRGLGEEVARAVRGQRGRGGQGCRSRHRRGPLGRGAGGVLVPLRLL